MRKLIYLIISILLLSCTHFFMAHGQVAPTGLTIDPWKVTGTTITPRNTLNSFQVPSLGSSGNPCTTVNASGTFATSTCGSSGSTTTINGVSGPTFTFNATSSNSTLAYSTSSGTVTLTIPKNISFFTNDSGYSTSTGGTPGGSTTQIQFNNSGSFGGAKLDYTDDTTTRTIKVENATGATSNGEALAITGADGGATSGQGGGFTFTGGNGIGTNSGGGTINFSAGASTGGGTSGSINLNGGSLSGYANAGISISGSDTDSGPGNVQISLGSDGVSTGGLFLIKDGVSGINAILNTGSLTSSNKTFTFPDKSGIFALTSDLTSGTVTSVASADGSITVTNPTTTVNLAVVKSPKLTTARTISVTGDLAYTSGSFDGTGNVTGTGTLATVNSNVGTFGSSSIIPVITVNGKGLVTAVSTSSVAGISGGTATYFPYYTSATALSSTSSIFYATSTGNIGIGMTSPAKTLDITGNLGVTAGTIATTQNAFSLTGTFASTTASEVGVGINLTGAGSTTGQNTAISANLLAGYTGSATTNALSFGNSSAGTGANFFAASGNIGVNGIVNGTTATGHNLGGFFNARNALNNVGVFGRAIVATNAALNIGVMGTAVSGTNFIGGYFGLNSAIPTFGASAALMADNGTQTADIFSARDNGTKVFSVADGGHVNYATSSVSVASCGSTPSGSVTGSDNGGTITVGGTATGCTLTFATAWTNAPACTVTNQSMSVVNAMTYAVSTTTLTITQTGLSSAKVDYICHGNPN